MDKNNPSSRFTVKSALLLAVLIVAGFAGNFFALRLFTGFSYLFGSIAVLLVVRLFGVRWGFLAALVASSWTIALFGHGYAMIWLCAEPLVVGWLLARGRARNVILYDCLYWPLVGVPLIWCVFQYVLHVQVLGTIAAMLMYWVIGISNALIGSLLLTYLPGLATVGEPKAAPSIPIQQLIFNLLMAVVVIPSIVVMILSGKATEKRYLAEMADGLEDSSRAALYETRLSLQKNFFLLSELEKQTDEAAFARSSSPEAYQQSALEHLQSLNPELFLVYIGSPEGRSVAYAPSQDAQGRPTVGLDFSDREYYKEMVLNRRPFVTNIFLTRGAAVVPSIAIGYPFLSMGEFKGYAVAAIKPRFFADILSASRARPFHLITLLDNNKRVIASTDVNRAAMTVFDPCSQGVMTETSSSGIYCCMPNSTSTLPLWQRAQNSNYLLRTKVSSDNPWTIQVETAFAHYQRLLLADHIRSLLVALGLNLLALVASLYASRRLAEPLRRLSKVTTDLPQRLLHEKVNVWPESMVTEIDLLIGNFRVMATALGQKFHEITYANETLEQRVEERTSEFIKTNQELQKEIVERKLTERQRDHLMDELVNQLRFLQTMINAIPNPIYYKDGKGVYQGCNRAFEDCLGFSKEDIIGKTVYDIFPPQRAEVFDKADQELLNQPGVQVYETQINYVDKLSHTVLFCKATYEDTQGKLAGLVGTIIDITERKQAETERNHLMVELRQKNKELEGIVYVASHDLRSPLVNVQGFSRKLLKSCTDIDKIISSLDLNAMERAELEPILRQKIPKALGFITGSIEKMDGLLNGLLRLSRLGRAAICFDTLDMQAILKKIIISMTYQIETSSARVELGQLAPCLADGEQVTQIFSNLLDNSLKYRSPERPLIINVSSEIFSEGVRYCVQDNGLGIAPEQQEKVWEIFQRLNPDETEGEGLGLTLARRIVDRLNGSIWLESGPDYGCCFYVVLPKPHEE